MYSLEENLKKKNYKKKNLKHIQGLLIGCIRIAIFPFSACKCWLWLLKTFVKQNFSLPMYGCVAIWYWYSYKYVMVNVELRGIMEFQYTHKENSMSFLARVDLYS